MAGIADVTSTLTNIFGYGQPLDIFLNVILPIPIVAYALYLFFGEIKILQGTTVRAVLGVILGATLVMFFRLGIFALWGGIAGILILKVKNWPGRLISLVIFLFIVSQITNLSLAGLNPQQILLLIFSGIALLFMTLTDGFWKQLIIVIAIFVFYYIVISYVPLQALQTRI